MPAKKLKSNKKVVPEKSQKKPKKGQDYEFKVYVFSSVYANDIELLTTETITLQDTYVNKRPIELAKNTAEEYVRNVGLGGLTVEDPEGLFTYYPPQRIAKVEYTILP